MTDEPYWKPNRKPAPVREAKPGEPLFEFVRASDKAHVLRADHGDGWEVQFLELVPSMVRELVFSRAARPALMCV
jgi:hypothetical protein